MYYELFHQIQKTLGQLDHCLEKAEATAKAKPFDPDLFLGFRLAPDQLPFAVQIGIACDAAKLGASRLSGKEAPVHADAEKTLAELRTRIQAVVAYLGSFSPKDFASAGTVTITQPRWEGKTMKGADYLLEYVVPNVFFHVTTAYAILRHNGVPLGKADYLGTLTQQAP